MMITKSTTITWCLTIAAALIFGQSAGNASDPFSLKIERSQTQGKVITVTPRNEEFRKAPEGWPYILTIRAASTMPMLRKGLFLKSKRAEIPLDTDSPPPVSLIVFVDDFEFVIVEVASEEHWNEWNEFFYFRVDDLKLIPIDAQKEQLPTGRTRAVKLGLPD